MMSPGQRCDEIVRLIEEALDGGSAPFARPVPAATTPTATPAPAGAGVYAARR